MRFIPVAGLFLAAFLAFFCISPATAIDRSVVIGTGGVTGIYYPAGGAICRLVNRGRKEHGIRCAVESTGGSIYNLAKLRSGNLDFAIVQSDWQYHAYHGSGIFSGQGPDPDLRSVFSLHSEAFTIVVRKDSGILRFDDLKGRRVNMGNAGSGIRATMEEMIRRKGWTSAVFKQVTEMRMPEQAAALCRGETDAIIYAGGNPNGAVQEVTNLCPTRILDIEGPAVDALVKGSPFYAYATIPGGMYPGNPNEIRSFGVKATVVTTSHLADEIVYAFVQSVFDNLDNFKTLHPVFSTLNPAHMITHGNTALLHPGAAAYFTKRGLYKSASY